MPVDPRHGRRIPSGRRLARAMAAILRQTWERVAPLVEQGYTPGVGDLRDVVYRIAMPALAVELVSGYVRTLKSGNRTVAVIPLRRRAKVLRFDPGDGYSPQTESALTPPTRIPPTAVAVAEMPGTPGLVIDWNLFRPEVRVEAERLALRLAGTIAEDTRNMIREQLSAALQAGEALPTIAARIRGEAFSPRRAATIAQTESSRAMHAGQAVAAKELGVTDWKLLSSSDACDICLSIEAKGFVKIGEPLYVHPTGNPAYRVVYHAPVHPHCNCAMEEGVPE